MHPILYKIGPITLYTYGFFLALGFLVAILVAGREAKRLGLSEGHFFDLCFYMLIAAIVGSRLLFVLVDPGFFLKNPLKIFAIWEGGLVFHGGLIAALVTAFFLMRRYKMPWRPTLDALAVGTPLGVTFGRIGCFMAGCCFGRPSSLPWAVRFTNPESLCPIQEYPPSCPALRGHPVAPGLRGGLLAEETQALRRPDPRHLLDAGGIGKVYGGVLPGFHPGRPTGAGNHFPHARHPGGGTGHRPQ